VPTQAVQRPPLTGRTSLVLAVILTCQLMVVVDMTIVNVALPSIRQALHFSSTDLSWVLNAYTLTFGGLLLLGARAGDLLGRRRVFVAGVLIFTLASLAGGLAGSAAMLLAARSAQGVGAALAAPSALALLTTMFPEGSARMRALGLYTATSIGGAALGLIAGGMLTNWVSWRWVLFVNVPIGLAVLLLARAVLVETPRSRGRFDLAGALSSTVGVSALVFGFVNAATQGWSDAGTLASFGIGVGLLVTFVLVELRAPAPITPLGLLADRSRASAFLARLLLVAGMFGMFFFLSQFLQGILGYSPLVTGFAFLPLTVSLFASSQLSARLVTRVGGRPLMLGGLALSTTGQLLLTRLSADSGYLSVLIPLVLFGIGNGLAFVPLTAAALSGVAPRDAGAASGLVNVMQQVGGSLGLAVLVTVYGSVGGTGNGAAALSPAEFIAGADRVFAVAALFLLLTLPLVGLVIRTRPEAGAAGRQPSAVEQPETQPETEPARA
jgi:EmrB/QacA subfamily drug resistance transporter